MPAVASHTPAIESKPRPTRRTSARATTSQLARGLLSEASRERIHQAVGAIQALLLDAAVVAALGGPRSESVAGAAALAVRLVELLEAADCHTAAHRAGGDAPAIA